MAHWRNWRTSAQLAQLGSNQMARGGYLPNTYTRVCNSGDLVPHLPTALRFTHAGRELFFDPDGLKANPSRWHRVSEAFKALVTFRKAPLAMLHAHSMRTYLINVMNSLEKF
ncbi:MAG: hypothetical protein HQL95_00810 [Magnetococcales bacterium]|nr:hypothetical protein [Magnetococcales bacterium]